ncbi:MAG: hypothetical protein ACRECQ_19840 [Burkholderiaceae bacterium]
MTTADVTASRGAIDWRAIIWATIISGLLFAVLEMILSPLVRGGTPWTPVRYIAGIVMGQGVTQPPHTFDLAVITVGVVFHMALSLVYVIILAFIINRMSTGMSIVVGAVFGLVLYLINFHGFTAVFPWWVNARGWLSIFTHIVFGIAVAWPYKALQRQRPVNP